MSMQFPHGTVDIFVRPTKCFALQLAGFAQPAQPAFGAPQQQTSLFGATPQVGFGQPSGGLFGQPAQSTSIFGGTSTAQPATSGFGSSLSTFGKPAGTGIFGGTPQTTSMFGGTSVFGGQQPSAFGQVQAPVGTTVKFTPTTGSDTMLRNGVSQNINTRHICITAMKEYESKSLEELRMEDYLAGRKTGAAQTSAFGAVQPIQQSPGLFGATSSTAPTFAASTSTGLFGQAKPAFGTTTTTAATGLFGNTSTFGKPAFGATAAPAFGSVQPQQPTGLFTAQPTTGFGATSTPSLFGSATQPAASKPFTFGQTAASQPSLFGTTTAFGAQNTALQQPNKPLFGTTAPSFGAATGASTPFPSFSSTTTTSAPSLFAQAPANTNLFSNTNKPFTFSSAPTFGTTQTPSLLGAPQNTMFGTTNTFGTGSSLFGTNTNTTGLFGSSTFGQAQPSLGMSSGLGAFGGPQANVLGATSPPKTSHDLLITRLQTLPYGTSTLFSNDLAPGSGSASKIASDVKTLNQFKVGAKPANVKRIPAGKPSSLLFDGIDDEEVKEKNTAVDIFKPKKNIKKLVLKPKAGAEQPTENASEPPSDESNSTLVLPEIRQTNVLRERASPENTVLEFARRAQPPREEPAETPMTMKKTLELSLSPATLSDLGDESSLALPRNVSLALRCGVKSTRPDYYTLPSLETLDEFYNQETGECIVNSFTIGRKGYGSIFWEGPLDISGLNLDELVHIRRKEVIVYPDDDDKPKVGEKLNRPAQVTLDQVWPVDKTTREIIKDRARLERMRYAEKLEATTAKLKATFKDYRPETGSWVFSVRHFSKYGLLDDDDEDEEMVVANVDQNDVINMSAPLQQLAAAVNQIDPSKSRKVDFDTREKGSAVRTFAQPDVFFEFDDVSEKSQPTQFRLPQEPRQPLFEPMHEDYSFIDKFTPYDRMRSAFFDEDEMDHKPVSAAPAHKRSRPFLFSVSKAADYSPAQDVKPAATVELPKVVHKKVDLSFLTNAFPSTNKVILDVSSVRCAPCPRVSFSHGSSRLITYRGSTVFIHSLELNPLAANAAEVKRIESQLQQQTIITSHRTLVPLAETRPKTNNPHNLPLLEKLVIALFGDLQETSAYGQSEERLNRVIDWLCMRNKSYNMPANGTARIFHLLAINDVKGAADECIRQRQSRLATLLACGTCEGSKELLLAQLDSWKTSGADEFIDEGLLKLYVLLSGGVVWRLSTGIDISPHHDLEWSQQLALLLLYTVRSDLAECITFLKTDTNDVEYHLLAGHSAAQVLSACANELEAWFLHESLISYRAILPGPLGDAVNIAFAAQLFAQSPKWATFIALHIRDDSLREHTVEEIVSRGVSHLQQRNEIDWLEKSLLVPRRVTAQAMALLAKSRSNHEGCARALIECDRWQEAHDILLEHVFPEMVINEEHTRLSDLISTLRSHRDAIASWNNGGRVYDAYMRCLASKRNQQLDDSLLTEPCNVHLLKTPTNRHVLCQSEMARKMNLIFAAATGDFPLSTPVPDDYAMIQLRHNAANLLDSICS